MSSDVEEQHDLDGGDIGLGRGLKPGALARTDTDSESEIDPVLFALQQCAVLTAGSKSDAFGDSTPDELKTPAQKLAHKLMKLKRLGSLEKECAEKSCESESGDFPVFAEVPLGTSIRQQKELFQHEIREIFAQCKNETPPNSPLKNKNSSLHMLDKDVLEKKLSQAQEVCVMNMPFRIFYFGQTNDFSISILSNDFISHKLHILW